MTNKIILILDFRALLLICLLILPLTGNSQNETRFNLNFTFDTGNTLLELNGTKNNASHSFLGVSTGINIGSFNLNLGVEHLVLNLDLANDFQNFKIFSLPIEVSRQIKNDNFGLEMGVGFYGGYLYGVDSEIIDFDNVDGLTIGAIARLGGTIKVTKKIGFSVGIRVRTSVYTDINNLDDYQQESFSPYFGLSFKI